MNSDIIKGILINVLFLHIIFTILDYLKSKRAFDKSVEIISKSETLKKIKEWLENDHQNN